VDTKYENLEKQCVKNIVVLSKWPTLQVVQCSEKETVLKHKLFQSPARLAAFDILKVLQSSVADCMKL
jgi:hypothetical protein